MRRAGAKSKKEKRDPSGVVATTCQHEAVSEKSVEQAPGDYENSQCFSRSSRDGFHSRATSEAARQ